MSRIKSNELSLSELIRESNLVVTAEFVGKFSEEISIKSTDGKEVPPFIKKGYTFKIKGVLKNKAKITVDEMVSVPEENWRRSLSQYKEAHANGASKSYTVNEYKTDVKAVAKATILFLHHFQGMYEFTAKNSWDSKASEEKIQMIIAEERD